MKKYFGTDGIRGEVNKKINVHLLLNLGLCLKNFNIKDIYIGYDTRNSNQMLFSSLKAGLLACGINVHDLKIISTPLISYYTDKKKAFGIMITASHNSYKDNGVKIFKNGKKLSDNEELLLEKYLSKKNHYTKFENIGSIYNASFVKNEYINFLSQFYVKTLKKIAVDTANGSNYMIAKKVYSNITDKLTLLSNNPSGKNINLNCGALYLDNLKNIILENKLDLGIAFDGDGDRLAILDNNGVVYKGDELIYILALNLEVDKVVLTKTSNLGLINSLKNNNIEVILSDVGDKNVLDEMEKTNTYLGGESSGHIILRQYLKYTSCGILNSLVILNILERKKKSLKELIKNLEMYPEIKINLKKNKIKNISKLTKILDSYNIKYSNIGKAIFRKSGTEDLYRLIIFNKNKNDLDLFFNSIKELIS